MPDLDKGQHGRVPIVLERSLADVQYSAHIPVVQQVGDFGLRAELFSHTKSQLFDALFQFLPSGGVDGGKSHINIVFLFLMQMYAVEILVPRPDEIKGNRGNSQANIQAPAACFTHFYLSAYLWLRYGMK